MTWGKQLKVRIAYRKRRKNGSWESTTRRKAIRVRWIGAWPLGRLNRLVLRKLLKRTYLRENERLEKVVKIELQPSGIQHVEVG